MNVNSKKSNYYIDGMNTCGILITPTTKGDFMTNLIPVNDIEKMATVMTQSKFFGFTKPEEAMALMLIAQAEGKHPASAAQEYHVIQGKPALKADAMLARFQAAGGKVQWGELSDNRVEATFSHASGGSIKVDWDMDRAKAAGLGGKGMWSKYPRQMLRSRVISEGVRMVYPGVATGIYTPEEVQDFDDKQDMKDVTPENTSPFKTAAARNKFCKVVNESYEAAETMEQLKQAASSHLKTITEMKESGVENDELAVGELRKSYDNAKKRIEAHDDLAASYGEEFAKVANEAEYEEIPL